MAYHWWCWLLLWLEAFIHCSTVCFSGSSNFIWKLNPFFVFFSPPPGFGRGVSADVQSQDAPPCLGCAAARCPPVGPPPDPAAAAATPAAAAADTSGCRSGKPHRSPFQTLDWACTSSCKDTCVRRLGWDVQFGGLCPRCSDRWLDGVVLP